ncbi:hypothetical protein Mgra_00000607 [Meloidogyne graminicola]|uniref:Uncharacterized protein n=1 Tax=Meloidogyne graminicola TaxID=189291 RepID=A0A8T0A5H1_9BILA|nr:hypothetical protein Mgra_00000607 [Meloidogyne graminicola]
MSESPQDSFEDLSIIGSCCSSECNCFKRIQLLENEKEQMNKTMENILLKIDSVEKTNSSLNVKLLELTSELEKLNKKNEKKVHFVNLKNSINFSKPNKFIRFDEGKIKYQQVEGQEDKSTICNATLPFCDLRGTLSLCCDFTLFYFEITMIMEEIKSNQLYYAIIDIKKSSGRIFLCNKEKVNWRTKYKIFEKFSWEDKDVFGCGVVLPPKNDSITLPYVFFTKNGSKIVDKITLETKQELLPEFLLLNCSFEPNFGNNLVAKPFLYNVHEHTI